MGCQPFLDESLLAGSVRGGLLTENVKPDEALNLHGTLPGVMEVHGLAAWKTMKS